METGLFDFRKMTVTVLKTKLKRLKPKIIHCRDYKTFSNDSFHEYLLSKICLENLVTYYNGLQKFLQAYIDALDDLAPGKKKLRNKSIKKQVP